MEEDATRASRERLLEEVSSLRREVRQLRSKLAQNAPISVREALLVEAEKIAHLGSWMWDLTAQRVFWSDELFRILGLDPAAHEASSEAFFGAIHPDDLPRVQQLTQRSLESGEVARIEFRISRPDGTLRDLVMDGSFIFDESGAVERMVGCCLDVTDPKQSKLDVTRSRAMLEIAQQLAGVGVFHLTASNVVHWSPEMHRILKSERPLSTEEFLQFVVDEDRPAVSALRERVRLEGRGGPLPCRIRRSSGEIRHVLLSATALSEDGAIGGSIVDITERIELEERLRQSQKMEALGRLAGGVAHDFNNLLTVIMGNLSVLIEESPDSPWARESLAACEQAATLTKQLLSFSRDAVVEKRAVDLNAVTREALTLIRCVVGPDVEVTFEPEAEPWKIYADPGQVTQVLMNLAINARNALPRGGSIAFATRNLRDAAPNQVDERHFVELRVTDDGTGMSEAEQRRAFEPLFTTKAPERGTGLGLATVFAIVRQHEGSITVDSKPDRGTEFRILWPRITRAQARLSERSAEPTGPPQGEVVLVVEDEAPVRRLVSAFLHSDGYQVRTAASVEEARRTMDVSVRLLLTDIMLPDGNGTTLAREVTREWPGVRVLYMTGHAADTGGRLDAPVLSKPFSRTQLLQKVRQVLD